MTIKTEDVMVISHIETLPTRVDVGIEKRYFMKKGTKAWRFAYDFLKYAAPEIRKEGNVIRLNSEDHLSFLESLAGEGFGLQKICEETYVPVEKPKKHEKINVEENLNVSFDFPQFLAFDRKYNKGQYN